jgi:hypothetical protein
MSKTEIKRGWQGYLRLHFHDEAPRIGSGWRRVWCKVGNKKATIKDCLGRTTHIPRHVLDRLVEVST